MKSIHTPYILEAMNNTHKIKDEINRISDRKKAEILQRFFKTGEGEYGEGDIFIGASVPELKRIAKSNVNASMLEVDELLKSEIHEYRTTALFILTLKFNDSNEDDRKKIFSYYLKNTAYVNNWDLVDMSAYKIAGEYLQKKDKKILVKLAKSECMWERRIAIVSTFAFIKNGDDEYVFKIAKILLNDREDLIHKAAGWMLREAGKRVSMVNEEAFLENYRKEMPRTMLRYAIERMSEEKRKYYLAKQ